ncbi:unnamed protein product [Arabis nemorensis]|uniref:Uncharacterized protein n=1 Tax=Arabis nemorensis TaxID=586526 RepID=A0A565BMM0_9BRAS|nr:unnamed protein product [Arabis nemorensis]
MEEDGKMTGLANGFYGSSRPCYGLKKAQHDYWRTTKPVHEGNSGKQLMQKIAELVLKHPERVKKQDSQKAKKQEPQAYTSKVNELELISTAIL